MRIVSIAKLLLLIVFMIIFGTLQNILTTISICLMMLALIIQMNEHMVGFRKLFITGLSIQLIMVSFGMISISNVVINVLILSCIHYYIYEQLRRRQAVIYE
jgi:hypothetical protein